MSTLTTLKELRQQPDYKPVYVSAKQLSEILGVAVTSITGQFNPSHNGYNSKHSKEPYEPIRVKTNGKIEYDLVAALCWRLDEQYSKGERKGDNIATGKTAAIKAKIAALSYLKDLELLVDLREFSSQITSVLRGCMLQMEISVADISLELVGLTNQSEIKAKLTAWTRQGFLSMAEELSRLEQTIKDSENKDEFIKNYISED